MLEQRIEEVNKANHAFYAAFGNLDIGEMDKIWAHLEYVTCIHPGWTLRSGWPLVRDSWVLIFNNTFSMTFELTDVMVQVAGDIAWVVCVENITTHQSDEPQQAQVIATNLFERIGDEWLMIHHHGSAVMGWPKSMASDRLALLVPRFGANFLLRPCLTRRHNADLPSESNGHSTAKSWSDWCGRVAATHRAGEHRTTGAGWHTYGGDRTRESWADSPGAGCDKRHVADGVPHTACLDHSEEPRSVTPSACHGFEFLPGAIGLQCRDQLGAEVHRSDFGGLGRFHLSPHGRGPFGTTTFYNFDTVSGSKQSIGTTDFYNFSDGSSATRNSVGTSDFYSGSTPSLSGSTNTVGGTTFGNWQDGTTSTHQSIGGTTFHNFSNGKNCMSNRVGSDTFTNCN